MSVIAREKTSEKSCWGVGKSLHYCNSKQSIIEGIYQSFLYVFFQELTLVCSGKVSVIVR